MIVEFETKAWITDISNLSPKDLKNPKMAPLLAFSIHDMKTAGWTFAGKAMVVVDLVDKNTLIDNKVQALREEAKSIRAEATRKCTEIEGYIQQLLCIEHTPAGD